jgi:hypothetical protein
LETLLFTYDFTDLSSTSRVIIGLQERIRRAKQIESDAGSDLYSLGEEGQTELLKLRAHIFLLVEELNLLFDVIKLAQDQREDNAKENSALMLQAASSEISWNMLDDNQELLAKLAVHKIDYRWLSCQDSSTMNTLTVGNLQAFDGSPDAQWTEILSKYDEVTNHPLSKVRVEFWVCDLRRLIVFKRGLFLDAAWNVLPPVAGITIYEKFELNFHPMRLQVDAKIGQRMMEYVWPGRKLRKQNTLAKDSTLTASSQPMTPLRTSFDHPSLGQPSTTSNEGMQEATLHPPTLRRLGASRSFTDLRSTVAESPVYELPKTRSTENLSVLSSIHTVKQRPLRPVTLRNQKATHSTENLKLSTDVQITAETARRTHSTKIRASASSKTAAEKHKAGDATEMRTRASQKTFVSVRVAR